MAKIIVFSNLKGGVGKSTLCCHFAHFLVAKNQKVALIVPAFPVRFPFGSCSP